MKKTIALFGSTGKTGRRVLKRLIDEGYIVQVLVRSKEKLPQLDSEQLNVWQGDVLNAKDVKKTVEGSDLVLSLFGHVKGSPARLQTEGTQNIARAMKQTGVDRIISLSGGGLPYPVKDKPKFMDRAIRFIMKVAVPKILNDAIAHAEVLRKSGLDWTIVRAPRLTEEKGKGAYRIGWVGVNAGMKISRDDLADFILTLVENEGYREQMPFVSESDMN